MPHTNSKRRFGTTPRGGSKVPNKNNGKISQHKKPQKRFEKDLSAVLKDKYDSIDESAINNFSDLPLSPETLKGLKQSGYKVPTQIQKQSIGLALQGKDILGAAQTGSGKTLAFLIPVLEKLYCEKWNRIYGVGALIITPTRELAKQIFQTLLEIGKHHDFSAGLIIGGKDRKFEIKRMDQCNIIICTPGRLLDHMDKNPLFDCSNMQILVLDEADRCLDMGFESQMNQIIENLPPKRQTLLFSATQTKSVKDLARLSLKDPSYVSAHEHLEHSTPKGLKQSYVICELKDKVSVLWSFVKNHLQQKIIIFFSSCKQVKFMFEIFTKLRPRISLMALYGTLHQTRRMDIYDSFCKKSAGVLFATDLAARGLDFPGVHWVVQADCPEDSTTYIHRVGRTARYHKGGEALLLLLPSELKMVDNLIERKIPIDKIEINPLKLDNPVKKMEAFLTSNNELKDSAQRAFVNYVKSIALMKDKEIFDVHALETDSLAYSFGLVKPPRIRFLQRMNARKTSNKISIGEPESDQLLNKISNSNSGEDSDDSGVCDNSFPEKKSSTFQTSQDDSDDDFLEVKQRDHDVELPTAAEMQEIETNKSKKGKPLTKAALAKKMLKKNVQPNKKIVFTDEGDAVIKGYNEKKSQVALEYENENVGGIDLERAKQVLKEEDMYDKQVFKEKVKAKHKEIKRKLKEAAKKKRDENNEKQDEGDEFGEVSDEDGEEPDLSWLPDPDKVYGRVDGDNEDEDFVEDHVEEQKSSKTVQETSKAKKKHDKKFKKHKKRNTEDEDFSPLPKKKKKFIENVTTDLSVNEAEELAKLLLKRK